MKKIVLIVIVLIIILGIILYNLKNNKYNNKTNQENKQNITNNNNEIIQSNDTIDNVDYNNSNIIDISQNEDKKENMRNARLKLKINGNQEIFVVLDDNQTSKDFLEMLPLTLTFEDFNNTEKIATLQNKLSTEGSPSGYTPQIGDFAYYAPWGNLSVFYKNFRYSDSLIKLGEIETGTEILEKIDNELEVTIERVN